jgi:hypothetical protein
MDVEFVEETRASRPAPPGGRIHQLHDAAMAAPGYHEVGHPAGQPHDSESRQGLRLGQEHVVHRQYHLLGLEAELHGQLLQRVDRGAVDIGLTGLAQASVAHGDPEAFQQAFERRRPAVHG